MTTMIVTGTLIMAGIVIDDDDDRDRYADNGRYCD